MLLNVGLLGHNIMASKSPLLHMGFGKERKIKVNYSLFDVNPIDLEITLYKLKSDPMLQGFNVTSPYKEKIIEFLDSYDDNVIITRSCNTIISTQGSWHGSSTDGVGWCLDLRDLINLSEVNSILILGFGGAARAVCYEINKAGLPIPDICVRDINKYENFRELQKRMIKFSDLAQLSNYDLIINATSVGKNNDSIFIPSSIIGSNTICYDLNYGVSHVWFKEFCQKHKVKCFDGFGMLQKQAIKSFLLWENKLRFK